LTVRSFWNSENIFTFRAARRCVDNPNRGGGDCCRGDGRRSCDVGCNTVRTTFSFPANCDGTGTALGANDRQAFYASSRRARARWARATRPGVANLQFSNGCYDVKTF